MPFGITVKLLNAMLCAALFFHSVLYLIAYRWRRLKAQMIEKRSKLGESQTLQQFSRDVDEIEAWISEKLQTASDESYKDPTNIQVNMILSLGIIRRYLGSQRALRFERMCSEEFLFSERESCTVLDLPLTKRKWKFRYA